MSWTTSGPFSGDTTYMPERKFHDGQIVLIQTTNPTHKGKRGEIVNSAIQRKLLQLQFYVECHVKVLDENKDGKCDKNKKNEVIVVKEDELDTIS